MEERELVELKAKLARLEDLQEIFRCWFRLTEKTWPSECSGRAAGGYDLDLLDSDIFGPVSSFLVRGSLRPDQLTRLERGEKALPLVISELEGFPFWWFSHLKILTSKILEYKKRWGIPVWEDSV